MPYIPQAIRPRFDNHIRALAAQVRTPGDLNYIITQLIHTDLRSSGLPGYSDINERIGVLECAKLELYRRIAVPYEGLKISENGDVTGL